MVSLHHHHHHPLCPPRQYLDHDVSLSEDSVHKYSDVVLAKLNKVIVELRRLFLVEDLVDSIKVRTAPTHTNLTQNWSETQDRV